MKPLKYIPLCAVLITSLLPIARSQTLPTEINFVRQSVHRMLFDTDQNIQLAALEPGKIVGLTAMHPISTYSTQASNTYLNKDELIVESNQETQTSIWLGGFNPFATYTLDLSSCKGTGEVGFEFSDANKQEQFFVTVTFEETTLTGSKLRVVKNDEIIIDESVWVNNVKQIAFPDKVILQLLGSGFVMYAADKGLPEVIAQSDYNKYLDLRKKQCIQSFQSGVFVQLNKGQVTIDRADISFSSGVGLADIRAITYEDGTPMLDQGRLWFTMSIRGRALPHHIQGVFSLDPTVFDIKFEGIIVFDRNDGILRNEIASHIFYDRNENIWRGLTTGFSAYANINKEKKQLLAVASPKDPRFGFSVMKAEPFGIVGDIEDPHILYDQEARKWRILTCENYDGYKAVVLESNHWNKDYSKIAGPVAHNSTGTSIQKLNGKRYCFSGSSEREIFVYTYPDLEEVGTLKMDLPPWNEESGTRVWPNVVQLPEGYPFKYVALMMDRFNYPGMKGPNWTYGALYLYHGYDE